MNYCSVRQGTQYYVSLSLLLHILCNDFYYCPLAALGLTFHVATCPSLCALQYVSAPHLVASFLCLDKSLSLWSPGSKCPLLGHFVSMSWQVPSVVSREWVPLAWSLSFHVLTSPSLCYLQGVSAPSSVASFPCPDKSLPLWPPGCKCLLLSHFLSTICPNKFFPLLSQVCKCPLAQSLCFHILMSPSLCHLQEVSAPCLVAFFLCPDKSLPLVSRKWVPLAWSLYFHALTSPSLCGLQEVSAPCLVTFFLCPDKSLPLWSPGCECP